MTQSQEKSNFDTFNEFDQLEVPEWSDDTPSFVRKRQTHDLLANVSDRLMSHEIEFRRLEKEVVAIHSTLKAGSVRLSDFARRIQRLEQTVSTGTNCLTSRVSTLEQVDKGFYDIREEDRKQLEDIKAFADFVKNFPFGFKGVIFAIVISVVVVATVTDITVRIHGIQAIKEFLKDD